MKLMNVLDSDIQCLVSQTHFYQEPPFQCGISIKSLTKIYLPMRLIQ